jgi:hypothetical protein
MKLTAPLRAVLHWLRAGYPEGVPAGDYVALFAVLHRKLTSAEVDQIAAQFSDLPAGETVTTAEIQQAIADVAKEQPGSYDIARVTSRLKDAGLLVEE